MPRQLWIDDHIEFRGDALHRSNVDGPMQETKVIFLDHFTQYALNTFTWRSTVTNGTNALSQTTYSGGQCLMTTAASQDNQCQYLASGICWEDDQNAVFETRIRITDASGIALFAGFTDADTYATANMPIDYADNSLADAVDNAVGFVCDWDDQTNGRNSIVGCGVNAGTPKTAIDSGTDWADNKWHTLRIELDPDGDANFYLDGVAFGHMATAVASGTKLAAMIAVANRDTGADTVYVDYVYCCQDLDTA